MNINNKGATDYGYGKKNEIILWSLNSNAVEK